MSGSVRLVGGAVYNSNLAGYTNLGIADTAYANTNVTCTYDGSATQSGWNSCSFATSQINGAPWSWNNWGTGHWYNVWQPA